MASAREPKTRPASGVLANAVWLYADQGLRAAIGLVGFSAITRHLGPEQFGVLAYAVAFPALFLPIATLGLEYVVVQELVRRPAEEKTILATTAQLLMAAALVSVGLVAASTLMLPADNPVRPLIWWTMLSLLGQPFQVVDFYFQSRVAAKQTVLARLGSSLVVNGLRLWLVWHGASVTGFAWMYAVDAAATGIALMAAFKTAGKENIAVWSRISGREAARLLRAAWPLTAAGVAMSFFLRLDQLLLSELAGDGVLGTYAAAMRLADAAQFVTYALVNSHFPGLIAARAAGPEAFAVASERLMRRITWLAVGVAVGVTVVAPWITAGLLGRRFEGAGATLMVLAWANVFAAQITVRGKWFLAEGWQIYSLAFFAVGAAVHLTLLGWLAPRYGAVGAAISFASAQAVMALLAPWLTGKTRLAARATWRSFLPVESP